jgi:hypothetical protein
MVLYTVAPDALVVPPVSQSVCQICPLGLDGYGQVIGLYGALIDHCLKTTSEEEGAT